SEKQHDAVVIFSNLRQNIPPELDDVTVKGIVRNFVTQITKDGRTVARSIHELVVGAETVPKGKNAVERALIALAVDAYPACLLPPDPSLPPVIHDLGPSLGPLLFRHPQSQTFFNAVLKDRVLKDVFAEEQEHVERVAMFYQNTGSGGSI